MIEETIKSFTPLRGALDNLYISLMFEDLIIQFLVKYTSLSKEYNVPILRITALSMAETADQTDITDLQKLYLIYRQLNQTLMYICAEKAKITGRTAWLL